VAALLCKAGVPLHLQPHLDRRTISRVLLAPLDEHGGVRVKPKPEPKVSRRAKERADRWWTWEAELVRRERGVGRG
jgi:hypothetical protein